MDTWAPVHNHEVVEVSVSCSASWLYLVFVHKDVPRGGTAARGWELLSNTSKRR